MDRKIPKAGCFTSWAMVTGTFRSFCRQDGLSDFHALRSRRRYAAHLIGVRDAAVIFPPGILLCVAEDIRPRDVMMDADLSASEPGEVFLSHVSASAIEAVCLLMIDSLDLETLMAVVPRLRFVGVDDRALDDLGADE